MKGFAIDWGPAMVTKQAQTNMETQRVLFTKGQCHSQ